jgi:hypothetical protein
MTLPQDILDLIDIARTKVEPRVFGSHGLMGRISTTADMIGISVRAWVNFEQGNNSSQQNIHLPICECITRTHAVT